MGSICAGFPLISEIMKIIDTMYDMDADAIFILFNNAPYSYGKSLDDERHINYAENGTVEFITDGEELWVVIGQ